METKWNSFGCELCRATPADYQHLPFEPLRTMFSSSHWAFALQRCKSCGQSFLYEFKEILDWDEGDDDMWTRWIPLLPNEVEKINRKLPDETKDQRKLNFLVELMGSRLRLTWHPNGDIYWNETVTSVSCHGRSSIDILSRNCHFESIAVLSNAED